MFSQKTCGADCSAKWQTSYNLLNGGHHTFKGHSRKDGRVFTRESLQSSAGIHLALLLLLLLL
jgi:hypothetical protein